MATIFYTENGIFETNESLEELKSVVKNWATVSNRKVGSYYKQINLSDGRKYSFYASHDNLDYSLTGSGISVEKDSKKERLNGTKELKFPDGTKYTLFDDGSHNEFRPNGEEYHYDRDGCVVYEKLKDGTIRKWSKLLENGYGRHSLEYEKIEKNEKKTDITEKKETAKETEYRIYLKAVQKDVEIKAQIAKNKERLKQRPKLKGKSGTVIADKIAEKQISGEETRPVTPAIGKQLRQEIMKELYSKPKE